MNIIEKAREIRDELRLYKDSPTNPIDLELPIIPPFVGGGEIKLIIIGQDPTIKNDKGRKLITSTLNLNKRNSLYSYINVICQGLRINIENVYATNLFKYFYTIPPANTLGVLEKHLESNLELLQKEISVNKNVIIITLGEPVLKLLTGPEAKVRRYWGYDTLKKNGFKIFNFSSAENNKLGYDFYPFPHQPSIRKEFYKNTLNEYIQFINLNSEK